MPSVDVPSFREPVVVSKKAATAIAQEKANLKKQSKISTPIGGEEGLTVSVIPRTEWASSDVVPPPEHWPFAIVDIFTGTSFDDPKSRIGRAQKLGDDTFDDIDVGADFQHLVDISDIHVRLTTQTGTGGECTVTFQNDLVRMERDGGGYFWKRQYFKSGRFCSGAIIRFLSDYRDPETKDIWYRGILAKAVDGGVVTLDGVAYNIDWINDVGDAGPVPREAGLIRDTSKIFVEDMGESVFEPMQKIKIFAGNRFKPEVLERYNYRVMHDGIPHMRMPGHDVSLDEILDFAGTAAYEYATNIFTGYVSDVSSRQQGGRWIMSVTARDVTCWLDYSMLNVNPSINIFGLDVMSQAEMQNWQIFTTRFEGMPAHEVIQAIFVGLREARTTSETVLYNSYSGTIPMVDASNNPVVLPVNSRLYIRNNYPVNDRDDALYEAHKELSYSEKVALLDVSIAHNPAYRSRLVKALGPVRYLVGTDLGIAGWVDSRSVGNIYQSYLGIGNFLVSNDSEDQMFATPMSNSHLVELFARDQLIIDPAEPNSVDSYVVQAYRRYFRQNWPLIQSEYATRRSIVNQVCKHSNSELYADGAGRVWFHPVRAYTPVEDPVYVINPEETISWEIALSDREIVTWAHVHGEFDFHIIPGDWIYNNEFTSLQMVKKFGVRAIHLSNPNIKTAAGARAYARAMLRRVNANMITGRITMVLRPELMLARNVFIPWLNLIGYIAAIDHTIQWGRAATTTISLKYIRHPWEPWFPLEYRAREEETQMDSPSRDTTVSTTKAVAGKQFDTGVDTVERAKPEITFTKLQGHDVQGPAKDAFDAVVNELLIPIVGDEFSKLNVVRTIEGAVSDTDPRKQGLVIDVEVVQMGKVNSTSPSNKYDQARASSKIETIKTAFLNKNFVAVDMYELSNNPKLKEKNEKGFLRLYYKGRGGA